MKRKVWIAGMIAALILAVVPTVDVAAQGWQKNGTGWWWENADGSYPASSWKQVGGTWYWFDSNGYMATGWVQVGGTWYYMDASGAMQTGWVQVDGTWYYMDASGAMQTGWVQVGGTWYYMDASGAMQTGWVQTGGTWYYMDASGAMQTDWVQVGDTWYYMDASGAMQTGWVQVGEAWYYMDASGAMLTDWIQVDDTWYYMESDGHWDSSVTKPEDTLPVVDGYYYDIRNVVLYLELFDHLPPNYHTKSEMRAMGWEGGSPEVYCAGAAIGGDYYGNYDGELPEAEGRSWTECDIDTNGQTVRGAKRLVFSNDGLYFYTTDHYETFVQVIVSEDYKVTW